MRVVLIEDDDIKRAHVVELLRAEYPTIDLVSTRSYNSGLEAVLDRDVDLILLDMTLTTFDVSVDEDGGTPRKFAGIELLGQMDRYDVTVPVIIVTGYDVFEEGGHSTTLAELDQRLMVDYQTNYRGAVYYNHAFEGWKRSLVDLISSVLSERPS